MVQGVIVKGIAGFYYIKVDEVGIVECRAKGVFRKDGIKPLVGDYVTVEITDDVAKTGVITEIHKRRNYIKRPEIVNVDQVLIVFSIASPSPNLNLLDRYLIMMRRENIPIIVVFNKIDLVNKEEIEYIDLIYQNSNCKVVFLEAKNDIEDSEIRELLQGKITCIAGPSGVGKSTLINKLQSSVVMQVGEISDKIKRGKHTTRHSELICIDDDTFIMDTPGFSALNLSEIGKEELASYYTEFEPYFEGCRFVGCSHVYENVCGVKKAVKEGLINSIRYNNYTQLYKELKEGNKFKQ